MDTDVPTIRHQSKLTLSLLPSTRVLKRHLTFSLGPWKVPCYRWERSVTKCKKLIRSEVNERRLSFSQCVIVSLSLSLFSLCASKFVRLCRWSWVRFCSEAFPSGIRTWFSDFVLLADIISSLSFSLSLSCNCTKIQSIIRQKKEKEEYSCNCTSSVSLGVSLAITKG